MSDEVIDSLNQITGMIDEKASAYKDRAYTGLPPVQAAAEKKLLLDLLDQGISLAERVNPRPLDLLTDFQQLRAELLRLP